MNESIKTVYTQDKTIMNINTHKRTGIAIISKLVIIGSFLCSSVASFSIQIHKPQLSSTTRTHVHMKMSSPSSASASIGNLLLSQLTTLAPNEDDGKEGEGPTIRLVLASQSPRRREILDMMGLADRYIVQPSPLDEESLQIELASSDKPIAPETYARKLAESKALALAEHYTERLNDDNDEGEQSSADLFARIQYASTTFILGSDTIVDYGGSILEKPKDETDAKRMLHQLSGSWHEVHTGVALYKLERSSSSSSAIATTLVSSFTDTARVKFTTLTTSDIDAYVSTGEPMDKAGSYGIQGIGGQMVETMEGDFFTVMGLPMHRLSSELAKALTSLNQ